MAVEFPHNAQIPKAAQALADVCRTMHQRALLAARDGNVSVRIGDRRLLVTPSGARKGFLTAEDMVLCDLDGEPVRGENKRASSEVAMHVAVYQNRPDVNAVVHAHPPCAVAHTIAGISLADPLMPEVYCELGEILTLEYTTPGTHEVPEALAAPIRSHDVLLLARHGSLTVGETLSRAYDRLEILEHTARISLMAHTMAPGRITGLSPAQLEALSYICG